MLLRLTVWHFLVLSLFTIVLSGVVYSLLASNSYAQTDGVLTSLDSAAVDILRNGLSESGLDELAARDAVRILKFREYTLAIYDSYGNLLAERPAGVSSQVIATSAISDDGQVHLRTTSDKGKQGTTRRVATVRITLRPVGRTYIVVASRPFDSLLERLATGRRILLVTVPLALLLAGTATWFLTRKSFAPALRMSEQALRMSAENLDERFPTSGSTGELDRLAANFNDLLSRLSSSFHLQRRFMADASHELRTPVSIICSAASVTLELAAPTTADLRESLNVVQQEGRRLTRIVEDMFYLARADSGGLMLQRAHFHLDDLLLETVRSIGMLASAKGVRIELESFDESPAYADEDLLRRVFVNLLANAVKYSPVGGRIFVRLEESAGSYKVSIRDAGPGIVEQDRAKIFERFYRVHQDGLTGNSGVTGGAGLGLPIARMIAEAHDGSVVLETSSEHGSVFAAVLPVLPVHPILSRS